MRVATHLANGHGAEDVQEDEGTVRGVVPQQVAMRQSLDVGEGRERELRHHSAVKSEKGKQRTAVFGRLTSFLVPEKDLEQK